MCPVAHRFFAFVVPVAFALRARPPAMLAAWIAALVQGSYHGLPAAYYHEVARESSSLSPLSTALASIASSAGVNSTRSLQRLVCSVLGRVGASRPTRQSTGASLESHVHVELWGDSHMRNLHSDWMGMDKYASSGEPEVFANSAIEMHHQLLGCPQNRCKAGRAGYASDSARGRVTFGLTGDAWCKQPACATRISLCSGEAIVHTPALWANTANFFPTKKENVDAAVTNADVIVINAGQWFLHLLPARPFKNECAAWGAVNHFELTRMVLETLLSRTRARGTLIVWRTSTPIFTKLFHGGLINATKSIRRGDTLKCDGEIWRQVQAGEALCTKAGDVPVWAWEGRAVPRTVQLAGACRNTSLTDMGSEWLAREELRAVRAVAAALPADSRRLSVLDSHRMVQRTDAWLKRRSAGAAGMVSHTVDGVHFRALDMAHLRSLMDVLALAVSDSPEPAQVRPLSRSSGMHTPAHAHTNTHKKEFENQRVGTPQVTPGECHGSVTLTATECWRVCTLLRGTLAHWDRRYAFDGNIPSELLGGVYLQPKHMLHSHEVLRLQISDDITPGDAAVHVFYNDRRGLSGNYWYSGGLEMRLAGAGFEKHAELGPGYDVHHGSHGNSSEWWSRSVGRAETVSLEINPAERQRLAKSKSMAWAAVMGIVVRGVCSASVPGGPCSANASCARTQRRSRHKLGAAQHSKHREAAVPAHGTGRRGEDQARRHEPKTM